MDKKIKKVLLLGSGALKIGEAGEFDYSGSQAAKALKEEGVKVVLVNPNIATYQTSKDLADKIYFLPVTWYFVKKIIKKEHPDGILISFGGQTALNCGLDLKRKGILKKYNVRILGSPIEAVEITEDRLKFRKHIEKLGFKVPWSIFVKDIRKLHLEQNNINFPVIVRAGFSLGGLGSGVARNYDELFQLCEKALKIAPQVLIEEYLNKWKELEYEIVRDLEDNAITVCNMENLDPMGIHTGESIVVAPSQTLNNKEYHSLREIGIKVIRSLPIVGECNIQFALNPKNGDYRIIEVNARLSRSSALASKATGYPLAYVAAKLALGMTLDSLTNKVTLATKAFFEPALDYVVVKIPRWDFLKFKDKNEQLGSEMQSVGEVMAIGRSFEEALQKAIRCLALDYEGLIPDELDRVNLIEKESEGVRYKDLSATPSRIYNIAYNLFYGQSISVINKISGIDQWFLKRFENIVLIYKKLIKKGIKEAELFKQAKIYGFSDRQIGEVCNLPEREVRKKRIKAGILPRVCQIDTLSGEFPAKTNYLYLSYLRREDDLLPAGGKKATVLGGGPYQIGSSVEFDWCAVTCMKTLREAGYQTIMINSNPETVSTDYDMSDRLYFEELTVERVLDILEKENSPVIAAMGGQIPNMLASDLGEHNVKFLGMDPATIDKAEDREKFSALLDELDIFQPVWKRLIAKKDAIEFADEIGYPVLVRPSYVLSGKAMFVAYSREVLESYLAKSFSIINSKFPMVISKFIRGAKEVDFDAVGSDGEIIIHAISEHVEHSGVHSGDATLVLPNFSLSKDAIKIIEEYSRKITRKLNLTGPFNIQYLVSDYSRSQTEVMVIEANLRASRSFPFVSKVTGENFIKIATEAIIGRNPGLRRIKKIRHFGVKVPHFSFTRLRKVDPVLRVEMASTGEVAAFGKNIYEAYLKALYSTGVDFEKNTALVSLGGDEGKKNLLPAARVLHNLGFKLYATYGTCQFLDKNRIPSRFCFKMHDKQKPNVVDLINSKVVSIVINISDRIDLGIKELVKEESDGYLIRRAAVDANIPLFTKSTTANLFVKALSMYTKDKLKIKAWNEYF